MGGRSKSQVVGFRYYMAMHFAVCYGPIDKLIRFIAGDRTAWQGSETESGTISIDAPELFGGESREGGIQGTAALMFGEQTQTLPGSVAALLPSPSPAFRGIFSLLYDGMISANNPYVKPMAFQVQRITAGWNGAGCWYPAKAIIDLQNGDLGNELGATSTGWSYLVVSNGDGADYSDPDFDDSSWAVGASPFASSTGHPFAAAGGFPNAVGTLWPLNTKIWVRRTFNVPNPFDFSMTIFVDNFSTVWVNGYLVLPRVGSTADPGPEAFMHAFTVPAVYLQAGENQITLVAEDFGVYSYAAFKVSAAGTESANAMNPAHIIYQCLTDPQWGMGYPTQTIDATSFTAAADTLYSEGLGLCMIWNQQEELGAFIRTVLDHCGGILYTDPSTGKFALKLLRADYTVGSLPVFDESNIVDLDSFQRVGYGDTVNEITVVYRDVSTNKDVPITVQNLANVQAQGAVVNQTRQYPGLPTAGLAARVAQRDLIASSTPLAKARMTVNREAWQLFPGQVFKLNWPKLGLSAVVMRVLGVDYGTLREGTISVDIAEDVFGLPASSYAEQEPSGWVTPDTTARPIVLQDIVEVPYRTLAGSLSTADLAALDPDSCYLAALAAKPTSLSAAFEVYSRVGSADFADTGNGAFSPYAELAAGITAAATTITLQTPANLDRVTVGTLAIIGTGRLAEWVIVEAIDTTLLTATISRGILDTTPQAFAAGAAIFFDDASSAPDATERATGETVDYKLLTVATGGVLPIAYASTITATAAKRQYRPYPPGKVLMNGIAYPTTISDPLTVTWAHRDRLQQTAYFVEQNEASIGPEAGTTYNAFGYDDDTNTLLDSSTGITGTSWTPAIVGAYNLRIEIEAQRDGSASWQRQVRKFFYIADGRLTEAGDTRITATGALRATE